MRKKKRLLLLLALSLLFALAFSLPASADIGKITGTFDDTDSGITYYSVETDSGNQLVTNIPAQLMAVGNTIFYPSDGGVTVDKNLRDVWFAIGATAYFSKFGTLKNNVDDRFLDIDDQHAHLVFGSANEAKPYVDPYYGPGQLTYAASVANAFAAMREDIVSVYKARGGTRTAVTDEDIAKIVAKELAGISDNKDSGPALYYLQGGVGTSANGDGKGHYVLIGIVLSNFKLTPIVPGEAGYKVTAGESGVTSSYVGATQNQGLSSITTTQNLTTVVTETVTNSIETVKSYSTSQSVDVSLSLGLEIKKGIVNASAELTTTYGFTTEETFSTAVTDETSLSKQTRLDNSMEVVLPPHTEVLLRQASGDIVTTVTYDCPVYYTYDVDIIVFTLDPGKAVSADPKVALLASFPGESSVVAGGAAEDFTSRFPYGIAGDTNSIDWAKGISNLKDRIENAYVSGQETALIDNNNVYKLVQHTKTDRSDSAVYCALTKYRPMSISNGTITYTASGTTSKVERIQPIHPLVETRVPDEQGERKMLVGEYLYVDYLQVDGYNEEGVPFYGFDKRFGSWQLVDENLNPLQQSSIAKLVYDAATGLTKLQALDAGTVYLQYVIDDETYMVPSNTAQIEDFTTQDELTKTAVIKVIVRTGTASKVEIKGELNGTVGDWMLISDYLSYYVFDDTDLIFDTDNIFWQAQGGTQDIEVKQENGQWYVLFKDTRTEPYQLRVGYDGVNADKIVYSKWHDVNALAARALDKLVLDYNQNIVSDAAGPYKISIAALESELTAVDQYGGVMPLAELAGIDWYVDGEQVTPQGNAGEEYIELPAYGSYLIHAGSNGIFSNKVTVKVEQPQKQIGQHFILEAGPHGSISSNMADDAVLETGTPVVINAAADTNYRVKQWLVDGVVWRDEAGLPDKSSSIMVQVQPFTQTVRVEFEPALSMSYVGTSLSLTGDIAINYYAKFELSSAQDVPGILFFRGYNPSEQQIVAAYNNNEGEPGVVVNGQHKFTYANLAAKEMNDTIYSVLYIKAANGEVFFGQPREESIASYAKRALASSSTSASLKKLCVDMLNYGAAAQQYFNYKTTNLANSWLTPAQLALGTTTDVSATNNNKSFETGLTIDDNLGWVGASLTLESKITINYYYSIADESAVKNVYLLYTTNWRSGQTFDISNAAFIKPMPSNGSWYVGKIEDIVAKSMTDIFYTRVCVEYDDGSYGYSAIRSYSVESYAATVAANSNSQQSLKNLTQMMMRYGNSAKAYFNAQ